MFFCLVSGAKNFADYQKFCEWLDYFLKNKEEVILAHLESTKCRLYVKEYARSRSKIQSVELKADMVSNRRIFSLIANDPEQGCVFFWDGVSRDVADDIKSAKECGIPCRVVHF
jgi:hypothetical protein